MAEHARNEPCPCGSGKKFKNCHLGREKELAPATYRIVPWVILGAGIIGGGVVWMMTKEWDYGAMLAGGGIILAGAWATFTDPPPPRTDSERSDSINFGN